MTLLSELIKIPEQVHESDFVISLKSAIENPARTVADYVVTEQLASCFDQALGLITAATIERKSKSSYLHASFGAGKSAFMAITHLLLQGEPTARAKPLLAPVVAKYADKLEGRRFLLVPYQAVGASSLEQVVLGGYVEYVQRLHPEAPLPPVYVADGILDDARVKRTELDDEVFFRLLSEGEQADEWGDYGGGWDATRFEAALAAPPASSERDQLVSALLRTHYRALPGQAAATAEGFVPIDDGLEAISRHAQGLGYDAVVLFLDELVLWLASRVSDVAFVTREGAKVVKLVEGDDRQRPVPIVSLIAEQRDLRELVGENVPGTTSLSALDILRHSRGRFGTITLEDRNLAAIAEQRLLRPRDAAAALRIDEAFEQVRRQLDERGERDVLLTEGSTLEAFRRLYPFSPALVESLVALSGAMQRERTALKVMLQLLVANRARLQVGQLVPLGDLFDVINSGEEPLTDVMRAQFQHSRTLWANRFEPLLLREHGVDIDEVRGLPPEHPFVTDARLVKTLLIAALVPEVGPLKAMTVSRLTALNSGIVRAFIPGTERQQVLDKVRTWASEVGELRVGDDDHDPTVSVVLQGIDTGPILDAARGLDNEGERRNRVRKLLEEVLTLKGAGTLTPEMEVLWRGTTRAIDVVFANVRNNDDLPDESLRAGAIPRLVIDYPWDDSGYSPNDDRARVETYRRERPAEWTAVWLPNFLTTASITLVGKLVRLDYVLTGDTFERLAGHLSPTDRPAARVQLANEQAAVTERVKAILRQAYGVDQPDPKAIDAQLQPAEQFNTLDPALTLRPPTGTGLRAYAEGLADQLFCHRYSKHPLFTEKVTAGDLRSTLGQVQLALGQPNGRLENVEATLRRVLTRIVGPLQLGTMHSAHFIVDLQHWRDVVERGRSVAPGTPVTVRALRGWIDGSGAARTGITHEVADLIILAVAAATDCSLVEAGRPIAKPEVGRLNPDWVLRAEDLPTEAVWARALQRAEDMGLVASSRLRSAASVADLNDRIVREVVGDRADAVRNLPATLARLQAVVEVPDDADRLRTAAAAVALVNDVVRRHDHAAQALADAEMPTPAAALGTSIKQAAVVAAAVERFNATLVASAIKLGGADAADAAGLAARLREAAVSDELVTGLANRLLDVEQAATALLQRAAGRASSGGASGGTDWGSGSDSDSGSGSDSGGSGSQVSPSSSDPAVVVADAESQLQALRDRLLREAQKELTWRIVEATNAGD